MNVKKLFLLIALICVVGIGNTAIAGHRHHRGCGHNGGNNVTVVHHHHRGCGHGGWSFRLSFVVPSNPSPTYRNRTLVLVPEHITTKEVWVSGYYEMRIQPPVNVWIPEHRENRWNSCAGYYESVLITGHDELRSSPSIEVWVSGHWKNINVLVPEHYEELQ